MRSFLFALFVLIAPFNYLSAQHLDPKTAQAEIEQILIDEGTPGAAVAFMNTDSLLWMHSFGKADLEQERALTNSTLMGIGSISKTFLSLAAMRAQELGLININTPIQVLDPSLTFSNEWKATDPVRFIHLLEHTSGFDEAPFNLSALSDADTPLAEVIRLAEPALQTQWIPGSYYSYNNLGAILAAYLLEEQVGIAYEDFLRAQVLEPLGMQNAGFHPEGVQLVQLAKSYTGNEPMPEPFPSIAQWPAGGFIASIQDMSAFVSLLLNEGSYQGQAIIDTISVERMETPESGLKAREGVTFGYGKGLQSKYVDQYLFHGHNGSYAGFLSDFGYSKELGIGYIILLNHRDGNGAIKRIKSVLLSDLPEKDPPISITEVDADYGVLNGCYQPITANVELIQFAMRLIDIQCMSERNGNLYQKSIIGDGQLLMPMGNNTFRQANEPEATSVFVQSVNEDWLWLSEGTYQQIPSLQAHAQFYVAVFCVISMLLGFLILLVWLPVRVIRKKSEGRLALLLPLLSVGSLLGMILSFLTLYDTEQLYSSGAILFFAFGLIFTTLSYLGIYQAARDLFNDRVLPSAVRYVSVTVLLSCAITATYLWYWGVIGLTLWAY